MNTDERAFRASIALVLEHAKSMKALHRLAHAKLLHFAIDVCLVAHGVRTGYLIDVICPLDLVGTFTTLLGALRLKSAVFTDVALWNHTPSMQSFLVHVPLLQKRLAAVAGGAEECVFIRLDRFVSACRGPPNGLQHALHEMRSYLAQLPDTLSFALPERWTEDILIPLAAVMIDYPVAYVPSSSSLTSFLHGEPLDVYEATVDGASLSHHVLLKFSCPQVLANSHPGLSREALTERLEAKFKSRVEAIGMHIHITHRTEILERVAL